MRNFFIFLIALLFLQGCANSLPPAAISIKQISTDNFVFNSDKCVTTFPAKLLASQSEGGRLFVRRSIFQVDDSILVLEKIGLDHNNFVFSVGLNNIIYAGFEFQNYKTTNIGNFHTFFEATDRNGENIYVLASGIGVFQDVSIIYSSSKNIIEKLSTCVQNGQNPDFHESDLNINISRAVIKSDWSARMLFKHDIIMSARDNGYFAP